MNMIDTVPARITGSTEASADSPRSALGSIRGFRPIHGTRALHSTPSTTGTQRMQSGSLQTQTSPTQLVESLPEFSVATTEAVSEQTINTHEPSMYMSAQFDSGPPTASTQAAIDADNSRHSLATSLSSELWVLGKLGESPGHSRTGSIGREECSANTALGRGHSTLLEASRSFQSRHRHMNSLESFQMDNFGSLDVVGVPVTRGGGVHRVSKSIVRNDEFEEVLNSSRAIIRQGENRQGPGGIAQDLSSATALTNRDASASSPIHPAASASKRSVFAPCSSTNTEAMHGVHASEQSSTSHGAGVQGTSPGEHGSNTAVRITEKVHVRPGWNKSSAAAPQAEARMHVKSVARSWPQGGVNGAQGFGVFQPHSVTSVSGRERTGSETRPRSPTPLLLWQTPADAA